MSIMHKNRKESLQYINRFLPSFLGCMFLIGCSNSAQMSASTRPVVVVTKDLPINVTDFPLSLIDSRMVGYISKERRLVALNSKTGEEIWWRYFQADVQSRTPYAVRDGVVLRDERQLGLFLFNGASSLASLEGSHLLQRSSIETQFVSSHQENALVINLLDINPITRSIKLDYDKALFPSSSSGERLSYTKSIYSFFVSSANETIISLELLKLKFARYRSTGTDSTGAPQFAGSQFQLCTAGDLERIGEINNSRLPVGYALDTSNEGALVQTKDGRLIYLHFETACSGGAALRIYQPSDTGTRQVNSDTAPLALGNGKFAIHQKNGDLEIVDASQDPVKPLELISNVCSETIFHHRLYQNRLLIICGKLVANSASRSITKYALVDLAERKIISSFEPVDTAPLAGLSFDNNTPKVYVLSDTSVGRLASYEFTDSTVRTDVKSNFILKSILNRL